MVVTRDEILSCERLGKKVQEEISASVDPNKNV